MVQGNFLTFFKSKLTQVAEMATSKEEKAYKTAESKDSCKEYMGTSALHVVEAD